MTLSDNLRVGDKLQVAPSWQHGEHNATPAAQIATIVYIHPQGRYCTVRYQDGLTDTVQTVPAARVAHPLPDGYGLQNNRYVRDRIRGLRVSQRELGEAMGHTQTWMNRKLSDPLSAREQQEIIRAAERVAELRGVDNDKKSLRV